MSFNLNKKFKKEISLISYLYIFFRFGRIESILRKILRTISKYYYKLNNTSEIESYNPENLIDIENLFSHKKKFDKENYIYIENFFEENFFKKILNSWPKRYEFRPPFTLDKFYDIGFITVGNSEEPQKYKWIEHLNTYVKSEKFLKVLNEFTENKLHFCTSYLTQTRQNSYVALHLDDMEKNKLQHGSINCNITIDSSESENCGNLSLGTSNLWDDLYFKSPNFKNSILIYKIGHDHYHGFKPVKKNEFRKAINVLFVKQPVM